MGKAYVCRHGSISKHYHFLIICMRGVDEGTYKMACLESMNEAVSK